MPNLNSAFTQIGRGFAAFLAPPSPDVIRFTVGQPDFDTPLPVVNAAIESLKRGETTYTRSQGSETLCQAVSEHLSKFDIDVDGNDVVIAPGCKQALLYSMMAVIEPGDEVLLLAPAWPSYDGMIKLLGGVPIHVPVHRPNYHPDIEALRNAVTSKTKAIVINSPNNPTGAVYTSDEIQQLVNLAIDSDLWILDDMIYSTLVWGDNKYTSPNSFEGGPERTLTIGGWSKGWAMTGWRLGWVAGPTEAIEAVKTCQASSATHVATFLMPAAEVALTLEKEIDAMADSFANRRLMFHEGINSLPGVSAPMPEGAFYILADVSGTGMTDIEFATRALDEAKVQVIPGSLMLGGDNLIRMSYATSLEDIKEGIRRLKTWLIQIN
ncbi:MAG: pyridoxal phosphate-dependent aminotransferase [Euryarchaeota archaeon]|nr:pyridoxal phosphate-dependent aminotransferase [Euryarchaeota archaeon]